MPRATTACNLSSLIWAHLGTWVRTRRFSEPTYRPARATNHPKKILFRDFSTFSRICIFFLRTFSLWCLLFFSDSSPSTFYLSILWEVWRLDFFRVMLSRFLSLIPFQDGAFRCGADANGEPLKFIGREDFPRPPRLEFDSGSDLVIWYYLIDLLLILHEQWYIYIYTYIYIYSIYNVKV